MNAVNCVQCLKMNIIQSALAHLRFLSSYHALWHVSIVMGDKNHWALVFWTVCEGLCPLMTQLTLESLNQPSRLRTMIAIMIIHICYTNQNMIRWRDLYASKWQLCCSMNAVYFFFHIIFFWPSQVCFYTHNPRFAQTRPQFFYFFYSRVCRVIYSSFTSTSDSHLGFKYTWRHVRDLSRLPATAEYVSMRYKMMGERVWAHF